MKTIKKTLLIIAIVAVTVASLILLNACSNKLNTAENQEQTRGFVASVYKLKLKTADTDGYGNVFDGIWHNSLQYDYAYRIVGELDADTYYDVNIQIAFYLGDEYIKTIENNFHLKGNGEANKSGAVHYVLNNSYTYDELLKLPIAKEQIRAEIVKLTWR